jgi:2'-5' RNA ligase
MDKKLYVIAELDDASQAKLNEINKIILENGLIGKQTKEIPYHITLCTYSLEKENYLKALLENISQEFTQINISFRSLGLFGLNVLFINPDMNLKLIELYNYLKDDSFNKNNDLSSHVTLLIDEPENILKILPKINNQFKGFSGKIKIHKFIRIFS